MVATRCPQTAKYQGWGGKIAPALLVPAPGDFLATTLVFFLTGEKSIDAATRLRKSETFSETTILH